MQASRFLYESRGIRSVVSRNRTITINAGGTGINVIRKCYDTEHPHCDMVHRPVYYDEPATESSESDSSSVSPETQNERLEARRLRRGLLGRGALL